mgnify:CR=1 FL=1
MSVLYVDDEEGERLGVEVDTGVGEGEVVGIGIGLLGKSSVFLASETTRVLTD